LDTNIRKCMQITQIKHARHTIKQRRTEHRFTRCHHNTELQT
jgi:hypothetical protein